MKRFFLLCILLSGPSWGAPGMSPFERKVVAEINLLRTQPKKYAALVRAQRRRFRNEDIFQLENGRLIHTHEGPRVIEEAAAFLERQQPLPAMTASPAITLACRDHLAEQGRSGAVGHASADGRMATQRIARYGVARGVSENIAYGVETPRDIVIQLVMDDGVPDRGHRTNFFRARLLVGVAYGRHATQISECVINMVQTFTPRKQGADGEH